MLAADKLQLQSAFKQQATALKEKEFSLHHNNLMTVGTQAAVLAGLDITMMIEFNPPDDSVWESSPRMVAVGRALKLLYYSLIVGAFCANMTVVAHTTSLSVLGGSLALRGPDGSMMTATDVLYTERPSVFYAFGVGLACTILSVMVCLFIFLPWEAALVCWLVTAICARRMYQNHQRVSQALCFDESQTVDFRDIFAIFPPAKAARRNRKSLWRIHSGPAKLNPADGEYSDDGLLDESSEDPEEVGGVGQSVILEPKRRVQGSPNSVKRRGAPLALQTV